MLTLAEVALRYRVSPGVIRRSWACGAFPAPIRVGRLLRWRAEELDQWEQEARTTAENAGPHVHS